MRRAAAREFFPPISSVATKFPQKVAFLQLEVLNVDIFLFIFVARSADGLLFFLDRGPAYEEKRRAAEGEEGAVQGVFLMIRDYRWC